MKKIVLLAVTIIATMTLILTPVSAAVSTAIANPGFEGTEIGNVYANDGQTVLAISTEQKSSGESSLKNSNRSNEYGAVASNVTDYIKTCGTGTYYCSFKILGTFDGEIRATLHTQYADGRSIYRQVGTLTAFKNGEWTSVGYGKDGKPLPLRIENWDEADTTKWDPTVDGDVSNAVLYFWVQGGNGDFYMDELNFWGNNDTPVSFETVSPDTSDTVVGAAVLFAAAAAAVVLVKSKKH